MSDIVPQAADNAEACQVALCAREQGLVPPDAKVYLLFLT